MSRINGDRSRFNRVRKQKIQQRARNRQLRAAIESRRNHEGAGAPKGVSPALAAKAK